MSRKNFKALFKTKVVLETLKGIQPVGEIAKKYKLYPQQIMNWKKEFLEGIFKQGKSKALEKARSERDDLLQIIGSLKVENEFLKKARQRSLVEKRQWIDVLNQKLSIAKQCQLLGLNRSRFYYKPR